MNDSRQATDSAIGTRASLNESGAERIAAFQRISVLVARSLDLRETLDAIVSAICELIGTEDALIAIREPGSDSFVLHPHPAHATDEWFADAFKHSLWDGVGLEVMRTRQPQIVRDAGSSVPGDPAQALLPAARAWVCVPLVSQDKAIGALYAFNARETDFQDADVRAASLLANQAATAISHARLHEETSKRLRESEALFQVTQGLARDLPLDDLLKLAVEQITAVVPNARNAVLHLLHGEVLEPRAVARARDDAPPSLAMRAGSGIAGRALAQRMLQHVPDTRSDPDFLDHGTDVGALIVAPLVSGEQVIGTLSVDSGTPHAFDADSVRLVASLASHAAVAISRARLFALTLAEKRRSETIINHMVDGVMLLDGQERIALINPMLAAMVGLSCAELTGKPIADAPYPLNRFGANLPHTDEDGSVTAQEVQTPAPERKVFKVFASPAGDGAGGYVLVAHDVTRERELDQAKTDFISTVSHELRTPLFSIRGFVKLLASGKVPDEATRQEFLEIVSQQADQLTTIVNDLLDVSRLDAGHAVELRIAPFDASVLTRDVLARLSALAAEKQIALDAVLADGLPRVHGDARRLAQVLVNLLGNAIKFTPNGGTIQLTCDREGEDMVRFSVTDNGIGIAPDSIPRLFERFYQADQSATRRAGGTGLGLYISRQIVEGHGGRIGVTSSPGKGSCFWFVVRAAVARISDTEASQSHGENSGG